jgi:hypothetical protein
MNKRRLLWYISAILIGYLGREHGARNVLICTSIILIPLLWVMNWKDKIDFLRNVLRLIYLPHTPRLAATKSRKIYMIANAVDGKSKTAMMIL